MTGMVINRAILRLLAFSGHGIWPLPVWFGVFRFQDFRIHHSWRGFPRQIENSSPGRQDQGSLHGLCGPWPTRNHSSEPRQSSHARLDGCLHGQEHSVTVSEHRPSMATVQTTEGGSAVPSLAGVPVNADLYHSLSLVQSSQKESIRSEVSHFLTVSNPEPSSGPPQAKPKTPSRYP